MSTVAKLVAEMHNQFWIQGEDLHKKGRDDDALETALTNSGNLDIACYHCGQKSHEKNKCP